MSSYRECESRDLCDNVSEELSEAQAEIELLRAALKRIADDDVDEDLKGRADILSGIAWAALNHA